MKRFLISVSTVCLLLGCVNGEGGPTHDGKTVAGGKVDIRKITNSIGMDLILIPAGEFQMGSPANEKDRSSDEKQHTVRISSAFYLSATEVTQAQYEAVMEKNPSRFKGNDLPVEGVSWKDAVEFCEKLSAKEGKAYRLPTEAEWEYACRAGTTTAYCSGDDPWKLGDYAWYGQNTGRKTHPVGQKKPNAWGLYDVHGNVWEWCGDWYGEYTGGNQTDPTGAATGEFRVIRGGSWLSAAGHCRSANRNWCRPGGRDSDLGFRFALSRVQR